MPAWLKSSSIIVAVEAGGKYGRAPRLNCVVVPSPRKYSVTYATGSCWPHTVISLASWRLRFEVNERPARVRVPSVSLSGCSAEGISASCRAPASARYADRDWLAICPAFLLQFAPGSGAKLLTGVATEVDCKDRVADCVCMTSEAISWPAVIPEATLMDVDGSWSMSSSSLTAQTAIR